MKMADGNTTEVPLKKGSRMVVTVEESIANVLLVCLKHGATLYRGVLLDSTKRYQIVEAQTRCNFYIFPTF